MKQTKICAAGFAAGCLSLAVLLGACAAGPTGESGEPASSGRSWTMDVPSVEVSYDRVGSTIWDASYVEPIVFEEAFQQAAMCAVVRIRELVDVYYYEPSHDSGLSIFSAEVLETYQNRVGYEEKEIYLIQSGIPEATYRSYPLFRAGDTLLLNLELREADSPCADKYPPSFRIINGPSSVIQLVEQQGTLYAVDRSLSPYLLSTKAKQQDAANILPATLSKAQQMAVRQALIQKDPLLEMPCILRGDVFLYTDIEQYLKALCAQETES